ncbi:MAG: hypothetical protein JWN62_491 [Acidimicrobiales bacterium]|nr:hypothetical protein [Acidimicrobiales bacterium]
MGYRFQVVFDCRDPHALADWWAETMQWQVEPQDEAFIRSMIAQGHASDADTVVHHGALVWREGAAIHPVAEEGPDRARWLFQAVPEPKTVKNRVHIDIRPSASNDPVAIRSSLVARGATVLHEGHQGPHSWVTMADPEGNEFCV